MDIIISIIVIILVVILAVLIASIIHKKLLASGGGDPNTYLKKTLDYIVSKYVSGNNRINLVEINNSGEKSPLAGAKFNHTCYKPKHTKNIPSDNANIVLFNQSWYKLIDQPEMVRTIARIIKPYGLLVIMEPIDNYFYDDRLNKNSKEFNAAFYRMNMPKILKSKEQIKTIFAPEEPASSVYVKRFDKKIRSMYLNYKPAAGTI